MTAPKVIRYAVHLETDKNNKDLYSDNVNSTNNIVNTTTYGKLALNKVASDNSNDYIKATFNIYQKDQDNDYSDNQVVTTITTTGTKDPILSDFLKPGDYVLVETSVEDGYVLNSEPIEFKIDSNKVTGLIKSYDSIDDAKKIR
ncbi:prealbumin-like fold domain-containing protein [Coprobacillaceae bacterium CR2/5/TPMF4]|nr:prealbumin-like fold domain-containing protein [Coprobacillaceae bacterium CR2/5/TPMF4]